VKLFFSLETEKTTFLAKMLKIKGVQGPPSDAHVSYYHYCWVRFTSQHETPCDSEITIKEDTDH